jgi:DNA-binding transcriptional ArsR family regulator
VKSAAIWLDRHILQEEYRSMDGFSVLAEPTRRRILDELRSAQRHDESQSGNDVATLVAALALPQPTVSKHLRVLREAGVVLARVDGPRRIYRLSPQPLNEVAAWLEPYRQMWIESLDALDRHLNTTLSQKLEKQEEAP